MVNGARTRSGTKEVLQWLHQQNILRIIYSNHNLPNIYRQLARLKINHFIDAVLARKGQGDQSHVFDRTKEKKLFAFVKQNKLKPKEVISVGDTEEEIQIGKQYGYHTAAITGGYNTAARLKKNHPDFLIHNMKDLIKITKKLNG
jgi:phosphoglycolate phosphatase